MLRALCVSQGRLLGAELASECIDVCSELLNQDAMAKIRTSLTEGMSHSTRIKSVVHRYPNESNVPLSENLVIYAYLRFMEWYLLCHIDPVEEVDMEDKWEWMLQQPCVSQFDDAKATKGALKAAFVIAMQYVEDMMTMLSDDGNAFAKALYCSEIVSMSLVGRDGACEWCRWWLHWPASI
jgi:hypothetical protein